MITKRKIYKGRGEKKFIFFLGVYNNNDVCINYIYGLIQKAFSPLSKKKNKLFFSP